jgi:hypothetical protein
MSASNTDDHDHDATADHRWCRYHLDVHATAALDERGGLLGVESFETTEAGYRQLVAWLRGFG